MVERLPRLLHLVADDLAIQPHGFDSHLGIVSLGAGFAPLSATYWLQSRAASAAHRTVLFGARPRMDPGTCAKTSSRCQLKHDNVAFKETRWDPCSCLLYTSDAADDLTRVDLGGRR